MRDEPKDFFSDATLIEGSVMNDPGLSGNVLRYGHKILEQFLPVTPPPPPWGSILEVGAGGGHVEYLKHDFREYVLSDSSPIMIEKLSAVNSDSRVKIVMTPAEKLPFEKHSFDRLIACHVLEHIYRPHEALREWHRVVRRGGIISLILPCDPGLAWRLGRLVSSTRRRAIRKGVPHNYIMAREHVNPIGNLCSLIRYHFENIRELWWPLRIPSTDLNLFYLVHIIT